MVDTHAMMSFRLRNRAVLASITLLMAFAASCGEEPAEPPPEPEAVAEAVEDTVETEVDHPEESSHQVLHPGENRFDPPIEPDQVPDGAWYCDMGTVHYASPEQGDGTCPICGMQLVQRGTAPTTDHGHGGEHHGP